MFYAIISQFVFAGFITINADLTDGEKKVTDQIRQYAMEAIIDPDEVSIQLYADVDSGKDRKIDNDVLLLIAGFNKQPLNLKVFSEGVTGRGFKSLSSMINMKSFEVDSDQFDDSCSSIFEKMNNIEQVRIRSSKLTGSSLRYLSKKNKLRVLGLNQTNICDQDLEKLSNFPYLTNLEIRFTKISDDGLRTISKSKTITYLDISGCDVTDKGLSYLLKNSKIKYINVRKTKVSKKYLLKLESDNPQKIWFVYD